MVPTFNEAETLPKLVGQLADLHMAQLRVLVVDDNSPDGTGDLADAFAAKYDWFEVLHRASKDGLGRSYVAGMSHAPEMGAARVGCRSAFAASGALARRQHLRREGPQTRLADATAGYEIWTADALRAMAIDIITSNGYSFQVEMNHRAMKLGLTTAESPITFFERSDGSSKMTLRVQWESLRLPWRLRRRAGRLARTA